MWRTVKSQQLPIEVVGAVLFRSICLRKSSFVRHLTQRDRQDGFIYLTCRVNDPIRLTLALTLKPRQTLFHCHCTVSADLVPHHRSLFIVQIFVGGHLRFRARSLALTFSNCSRAVFPLITLIQLYIRTFDRSLGPSICSRTFGYMRVIWCAPVQAAESCNQTLPNLGKIMTKQLWQDGQAATNDATCHFGYPERGLQQSLS